jgi:acyl-coenzyme A synthetase/AMP-(fatty) acid ligase
VFVIELPKTPAGKVNRKVLRDREAAEAIRNATSEEQKHADT